MGIRYPHRHRPTSAHSSTDAAAQRPGCPGIAANRRGGAWPGRGYSPSPTPRASGPCGSGFARKGRECLLDDLPRITSHESRVSAYSEILVPDAVDRSSRTSASRTAGPCASAAMLGVRFNRGRTFLERASLRYSLMREMPKAPPLPPPPGPLPPRMGMRVPLWGGGPSDKQRKARYASTVTSSNWLRCA